MSAISEIDLQHYAEDRQLELFSFAGKTGVQDKTSVDAILDERGKRYGTFEGHAEISQAFKEVISTHLEIRNKILPTDMCEALDMISHKMARIINGDPNYADSWVDIAGYAKLVADRLEGKVR